MRSKACRRSNNLAHERDNRVKRYTPFEGDKVRYARPAYTTETPLKIEGNSK